jgi:UDPglucose 6-dehydrogenase
MKTAQDHGSPVRLVETVVAVNDQRKRAMARKVIAACGGSVRGKLIAILGLTFKPNTDDMRDAPSCAIISALQDAGARIRAYDPEGMEPAKGCSARSNTPRTPIPARRAPTRSCS